MVAEFSLYRRCLFKDSFWPGVPVMPHRLVLARGSNDIVIGALALLCSDDRAFGAGTRLAD